MKANLLQQILRQLHCIAAFSESAWDCLSLCPRDAAPDPKRRDALLKRGIYTDVMCVKHIATFDLYTILYIRKSQAGTKSRNQDLLTIWRTKCWPGIKFPPFISNKFSSFVNELLEHLEQLYASLVGSDFLYFRISHYQSGYFRMARRQSA